MIVRATAFPNLCALAQLATAEGNDAEARQPLHTALALAQSMSLPSEADKIQARLTQFQR